MRLRGAEHDAPADIGERTPDIDPAPMKVDVTYSESSGFSPAQAGGTEGQDQQPPGCSRGGKVEDLAVVEEDVISATWTRETQPSSRVGSQTATAYRVIRGCRQDEH